METYSVVEAARISKMDPSWIRRKINTGDIRANKVPDGVGRVGYHFEVTMTRQELEALHTPTRRAPRAPRVRHFGRSKRPSLERVLLQIGKKPKALKTTKQFANMIGVSPSTISYHANNLKLDVQFVGKDRMFNADQMCRVARELCEAAPVQATPALRASHATTQPAWAVRIEQQNARIEAGIAHIVSWVNRTDQRVG